jgi:hypothetical protein
VLARADLAQPAPLLKGAITMSFMILTSLDCFEL